MRYLTFFYLLLFSVMTRADYQDPDDFYPFPNDADSADTTAVYYEAPGISGWADGYTNLLYGTNVEDNWKTPEKALGTAGTSPYDIVCLGRNGQITMSFSLAVANGPGFDFAVFENGIDSKFLELAWVEVSSDGEHFVRFPNYYRNESPVGQYGGHDTRFIYGLASKYEMAYGTPFDLSELQDAYDAVIGGVPTVFTSDYINSLTNNFPHLNLNNINYIRLIDIVGDGSAEDASGHIIYDPYPTNGSAGFDLDAVAAFYQQAAPPRFTEWADSYGLTGSADSDFDNDGSPDIEEYFFGTDPTNNAETETISAYMESDSFKIRFHQNPDAVGKVDVQTISDLNQVNWYTVIPESVIINGAEVILSFPVSHPYSFYRLYYQGTIE